MIDASKSLNEVVKQMGDIGAAMLREVGEAHDGTPLYAMILTQGEETTEDVIALLDAYDNSDEDKPNPVKAMVAGPELLEALELARDWLVSTGADGSPLPAIEAAIAKAHGEPVASDTEDDSEAA